MLLVAHELAEALSELVLGQRGVYPGLPEPGVGRVSRHGLFIPARGIVALIPAL
jgi:hypothetical protein